MALSNTTPLYFFEQETLDSLTQEELRQAAQNSIDYGAMLFEKCELEASKTITLEALKLARQANDQGLIIDALSRLLRLAAEALDQVGIQRWTSELDAIPMDAEPQNRAKVLYAKAVVAGCHGDFRTALETMKRALHPAKLTYMRDRTKKNREFHVKILYGISAFYDDCGDSERASKLARAILKKHGPEKLKLINGSCHVVLGSRCLEQKELATAQRHFELAHAAFLEERNWFAHLYVLFRYAQVARLQQNFTQAWWYLNLMETALTGEGFESIRKTIADEKVRLEKAAVDLLIDSRSCEISTREAQKIALGKQYVLLGILEALTEAHSKDLPDAERGLSKAEIIERVWNEKYRPEAHDNKLYYNINRLRKLIEPDMRHPKYLLNWKEGYRLAPGLKVHYVGGTGGRIAAVAQANGGRAAIEGGKLQ